jgi:hypothetical protein
MIFASTGSAERRCTKAAAVRSAAVWDGGDEALDEGRMVAVFFLSVAVAFNHFDCTHGLTNLRLSRLSEIAMVTQSGFRCLNYGASVARIVHFALGCVLTWLAIF